MCVLLPLCAVGLVILVAGIVGATTQPDATAAHQARVQEYEAKSFPKAVELGTGRRAQGFVFFRLPATGESYSRATVANMAGSPTPRPFVLHLEIDDGQAVPAADRRSERTRLRVPLQ